MVIVFFDRRWCRLLPFEFGSSIAVWRMTSVSIAGATFLEFSSSCFLMKIGDYCESGVVEVFPLTRSVAGGYAPVPVHVISRGAAACTDRDDPLWIHFSNPAECSKPYPLGLEDAMRAAAPGLRSGVLCAC